MKENIIPPFPKKANKLEKQSAQPTQHGSPIPIMYRPKRRITSAIMMSFAIKTQ
jgi:hypothetical protein